MSEELRDYETVCIVDPDLPAEDVQAIIDRSVSIIETGGGSIHKLDDWGRRRLAYPINKKTDGHYFIPYFSAPNAAKVEFERILRLNENVIRYQTIVLDAVGLETLKNSIAAAEAVAEQAEKDAAEKAEAVKAAEAAAAAVAAAPAPATEEATPATDETEGGAK